MHVQHTTNAKYTKYLHLGNEILLEHKCNINQNKTKQGKCLLPLNICIFPITFSPYECAQGRISLPKNVHMSHLEMTKHTNILSPILSRIDKWIKRKGGKENKIWTRVKDDVWGVMCFSHAFFVGTFLANFSQARRKMHWS